MGRPIGSKNRPKEATIGDNSEIKELTPEQKRTLLLQACQRISPMKDEIATIIGEMRVIYREYKADGIPKKDIDLALSLQRMDEDGAIAEVTRRAQIIEWIHPGIQAELDFDQAAE